MLEHVAITVLCGVVLVKAFWDICRWARLPDLSLRRQEGTDRLSSAHEVNRCHRVNCSEFKGGREDNREESCKSIVWVATTGNVDDFMM